MSGAIDVRKLPGAKEITLVRDAGYFPVLALLGEREVVAVLRGGAGHLGLAGRLELVRSRDGGRTWLPPAVIADSDRDDRNPAIGVVPDGTLVVAYHHQGSYDEQGRYNRTIGIMDTLVIRSHDGGHSWERPRRLDYGPLNGRSPYGPMVNFPDGTLAMCIYGMPMGDDRTWEVPKYATYILRSGDNGATWGDPSLVAEGFNETAFMRFPDGELLAAVRSPGSAPNIYIGRSVDDGRTWVAPLLATEPGEHPADLALLSNGWVLMTYGHRRQPFGVQGMISRDRGKTWDRARRLIYNDDRPGGDCGYPATVRSPDGMLLTVYYSAGDHMDSYRVDGAFAAGVLYPEEELVAALA
jgi:hypothetical protein